jgi:integrase
MSGKRTISCFVVSSEPRYRSLTLPTATFRPILERAGLLQIRLYDLRHSHATLLLAADEHLKVVSERLGHSTIRLTADTYSHVLESMQQETASKLESMLYGT